MSRFKRATKVASHNKRNASIVKFVGACIFICLVFCAGFMARGNTALLEALGLSSLETESEVNPGMTVSGSTYESLSARIAEVEGILEQESVDSIPLDQSTQYVLEALFSSMDDDFLHYYNEQSYQAYLSTTSDSDSGVGVLFGESDEGCYAADVFEESSASASGVQAGDYIISIDGQSKDVWTMPEVLEALSRADGEEVIIGWKRNATSTSENETTFTTTLTFSSDTEENVSLSVEDGVATIDITQITSNSATLVSDAVNSALSQGATSFILDLRDVPGGYLTQAVDIASLFVASGTIVQIQTVDGVSARSADGETLTSAPLVVLVNNNTSGCAEVLAAALQDTDRATLVGVQSQGKGSVHVIQPLSYGGAIRYTAAYYLTPKGAQINGNGVYPDMEATDTDDQDRVAVDVAISLVS